MRIMKVLVVFTGGTIGSAPDDGYFAPGGKMTRKQLLEYFAKEHQASYEKKFQTKIQFETICPYEILSENLNGNHIEMLWNALYEQLKRKVYDGVIVTVGTDTLAYSSAALGYMFADTQIPIVTVSANYPLSDKKSNGFVNFEKAVHLIMEGCHKGVFCSYNNAGKHYFHYGTRMLQQANYSDLIYSVLDSYYAFLEKKDGGERIVCKMPARKKTQEQAAGTDDNMTDVQEAFNLKPGEKALSDCHIAFLRPYPGMVFPDLTDLDAVLFDTYHSGTIPVKGGGFAAFLQKAQNQKVPVFVAGVPSGLTYETMKAYKAEGAHVLPQASPIAMYVKMWLLLSNKMDLKQYMSLPVGKDIVA